jgi:alginate O-acetyltransferase complex protein AlgI
MLFNTPLFIIYLFITLFTFLILPKKADKLFLLLASYVFYGYWDYRFLFLLVGSSLMDYYLGNWIYSVIEPIKKKRLLYLSLVLNLSILGFFKYFNFFIDSFNNVFPGNLDFLHVNVILPVGISFYTFQSLSYTFDVYRGKLKPTKSILDYCLFVGVFPHMVSGPIVKAVDLLPQLKKMNKPLRSDFLSGFSLITVGMFQKVLIGDTVARHVDHIFSEPTYYSSSELLFSIFMFSIQIYADFSGYSKIARGSAKLFGIDLINNFSQPYLSYNITDFWRRWHISLSEWLRDYVYIWWLGGNRISKFRTYINLLLTMLIGGIWHGANWTFVVWGGFHGVALGVHKYFSGIKSIDSNEKTFAWHTPFWIVITYLFVVFAWLFFRAPDFRTAWFFLDRIFINQIASTLTLDLLVIFLSYLLLVIGLDLVEIFTKRQDFLTLLKLPILLGIVIPVWLAIILYLYTVGKPMPFIYFQF